MAPKWNHMASLRGLFESDCVADMTRSPFPRRPSMAWSHLSRFAKYVSRLLRWAWSSGVKIKSEHFRLMAWSTYSRWHRRRSGNVHHRQARMVVWRCWRCCQGRDQKSSGGGRKSGVKKPSREPGLVLLKARRINHLYSWGLERVRLRCGEARGRLISRLYRKINWRISTGRDSRRERGWSASVSDSPICDGRYAVSGCLEREVARVYRR